MFFRALSASKTLAPRHTVAPAGVTTDDDERNLRYVSAMKLDLPPVLDAFVKDLVAQGRYTDEADVVRDAVRRLAENDLDPETGTSMKTLRAELAEAASGPMSNASIMDVFERAAARAS
jgi:putative addiction module CopG family antidote